MKVDKIVGQNFFDEKTARTHWKEAIQKKHDSILGSKTLLELEINMNEAIAALGASHCEFITENNETFHFLHALFGSFNKKLHRGNADYVGFETGGIGFEDSRVRFVLDGSPAERAGLEVGDRIEKVNGSVYRGHCDFIGKKDRHVSIQIRRDERLKNLRITPLSRDIYKEYVAATEKSAKVVDRNGHKLGYVHLWCGGGDMHDALDEIISQKLSTAEGIVLDLRDGYGGNGLEDLDRFYRRPKEYPTFVSTDRKGKRTEFQYYYDRPLVVIINGGSRSGKELIAYSLKMSGRARLVGTTTAGAVLAGRLFPIDSRCSLYLAIMDCAINGDRLEGKGVSPDLKMENLLMNQAGYELQQELAMEELNKMIEAGKTSHGKH